MKEYQSKFQDDARDLLSEIEQSLLALEQHPQDKAFIEEVFRAMHTLKGAANMFEYRLIGTFTHQLENVYDTIRGNRRQLNLEILNFTLDAVDHLRDLVEQPSDPDQPLRERHHLLEQRIVKLMQQTDEQTTETVSGELAVENAVAPTYYIYLRPLEGITVAEDGPAYLFEQISDLGDCKICYAPSSQTDQDCQTLVPQWIIYVATEQGQDAIEGIFLFADDEYSVDIQLLSANNLLQQPPFVQKIDEVTQSGEIFPFEQLQHFVQTLSAAIEDQ